MYTFPNVVKQHIVSNYINAEPLIDQTCILNWKCVTDQADNLPWQSILLYKISNTVFYHLIHVIGPAFSWTYEKADVCPIHVNTSQTLGVHEGKQI